jgi:DNA-nicking Smr family endonuclease
MPMTDTKDKDPTDDSDLFRSAMKGVRLLETGKHVISKKPPAPIPSQLQQDRQQVLAEMASGELDFEELESGDEGLFQRPGISRSVLRKLRRGQFSVQSELDLHGLTVTEAHAELSAFLGRCSARGMVCVRIIHGKGRRSPGKMPILKPRVFAWLSKWDDVAAFCSARPVDGGTGALYVLLKNR